MSLSVRARTRLGAFHLDVACEAGPGEVVAVLGPNGAGKSTLLRAVAGLVALDRGRITLAGRVLDDPADGMRLPPEQRRVGMVFQDYLLFPHLSALDNVAFGLRAAGAGRRTARRRAGEWLERVGIAEAAGRRPGALSGGQAQRVALARALATEPDLLVLDEPMAALDADARQLVRASLREHLSTFAGPVLLVTHEPLDAIVLADRLIVLEQGRVTQDGSVAEITRAPRSTWIARLVGVNLYEGSGDGDDLVLADGARLHTAEPVPARAYAVVHPNAIALYPEPPHGSVRNTWRAVVAGLEPLGPRVRVHLDGAVPATAEVTPAGAAELHLAVGSQVWVSVKATEVSVQPAEAH